MHRFSDEMGFGIIGTSAIAATHATTLETLRDMRVRLRAVLGSNAARVHGVSDQFGAEAVLDSGDFFARRDIQAVIVCTTSATHAEWGRRAAAAGKHVLVEKPIDISMDAARGLVAACERSHVALGVVMQSRFVPAVELIKKAVTRGRFGRIYVVDVYVKWFRPKEYYDQAPWRGSRAIEGGGALIKQGIHSLDLAQHFAGAASWVYGLTERKRHGEIEVEDLALALVRYENGATGVLEASTSLSPGFSRRVELHGERGSVVLEGDEIRKWEFVDRVDEECEAGPLDRAHREGAKRTAEKAPSLGHIRQLADFITAVRTGRSPAVDGLEGIKSLATVLAIYDSAEREAPVAILRSDR